MQEPYIKAHILQDALGVFYLKQTGTVWVSTWVWLFRVGGAAAGCLCVHIARCEVNHPLPNGLSNGFSQNLTTGPVMQKTDLEPVNTCFVGTFVSQQASGSSCFVFIHSQGCVHIATDALLLGRAYKEKSSVTISSYQKQGNTAVSALMEVLCFAFYVFRCRFLNAVALNMKRFHNTVQARPSLGMIQAVSLINMIKRFTLLTPSFLLSTMYYYREYAKDRIQLRATAPRSCIVLRN